MSGKMSIFCFSNSLFFLPNVQTELIWEEHIPKVSIMVTNSPSSHDVIASRNRALSHCQIQAEKSSICAAKDVDEHRRRKKNERYSLAKQRPRNEVESERISTTTTTTTGARATTIIARTKNKLSYELRVSIFWLRVVNGLCISYSGRWRSFFVAGSWLNAGGEQ